MPLFKWKDDYSVAVAELDEHHRELFGIVNQIYACCMNPGNLDQVSSKLDELAAYADYHFSAEEQHMKDIGFNGLEDHQAKHRIFRSKVETMRFSGAVDKLDVTRELIVYLGNWLLHHVLEEDKKYIRL